MKCSKCGSRENLSKYSRGNSGKMQYFYCRECNTKRLQDYRKTDNGRVAVRRAVKKYEAKNKQRVYAWNAVKRILQKPCVECGKLPTHKHHPNPREKLNIVFLCPLHHKRVHLLALKT